MSVMGVFVIIGVWAYISITTGALVSWGTKDVGVIVALLGAKVFQKGKEENIVRKEGEK